MLVRPPPPPPLTEVLLLPVGLEELRAFRGVPTVDTLPVSLKASWEGEVAATTLRPSKTWDSAALRAARFTLTE